MPANTIYVGRGSIWGNPFRIDPRGVRAPSLTAEQAVRLFEQWLTTLDQPVHGVERAAILANLHRLRGKNLACWCPLDQPCHADVLLRLAAAPFSSNPWAASAGTAG